jgi:hypothetical protein
MKRFCLVVCLVFAPAIVWAQNVKVSYMAGPVEIRHNAPKATFVRLTDSIPQVQVGDQIRTGDGGTMTLTLLDGSYMVVTPNSTITVDDQWSGGLRNIANVVLGKVRFFIKNLGDGKPNPIRVGTPTALIAVRGTIFEVTVEDGQTEVWCLENHVGVESATLHDREVILDPGKHTLVRKNENPLMPVDKDVAFPNRSIAVAKKDPADGNKNAKGLSLQDPFARDNDRSNRPVPGISAPNSTAEPAIGRAKPTLTYPE